MNCQKNIYDANILRQVKVENMLKIESLVIFVNYILHLELYIEATAKVHQYQKA